MTIRKLAAIFTMVMTTAAYAEDDSAIAFVEGLNKDLAASGYQL